METEKDTTITDDAEKTTGKVSPRSLWQWGTGIVIVVVIVAAIATITTGRNPEHQPTAEALEQIQYDSEKEKQAQNKTELIRDQNFIVREEDRAQSNQLLKNLDSGQTQSSEPSDDRKVEKEEEAIEHVLRKSPPQAVVPNPPQPTESYSRDVSANAGNHPPMFVYSRALDKVSTEPPGVPVSSPDRVAAPTSEETISTDRKTEPVPETAKKTQLVYNNLPTVTLHEGEMLEAVLSNRLIVDTEASPVVCTLSRDLFDRSGQYVVLPANSRVIGESQIVSYKGAHRLFIGFRRIILPNGLSVDLPSNQKTMKALDETGALGIVSNVDRHWFLQFGTSIFFGVLDGLSGAAQRNQEDSLRSAVFGRTSENFDRVLENIMSQYSSIVPTIRVDQGKTLRIYLSDDILISPYARIEDRSYHATH